MARNPQTIYKGQLIQRLQVEALCESGYWPTDCVEGPGILNKDGYRRVQNTLTHRYTWERYWGQKVPPGMVLDHFVCDNRECCNPLHTRPDTVQGNIRRSHPLKVQGHGTYADYRMHIYRGTEPCAPCRQANADQERNRRQMNLYRRNSTK